MICPGPFIDVKTKVFLDTHLLDLTATQIMIEMVGTFCLVQRTMTAVFSTLMVSAHDLNQEDRSLATVSKESCRFCAESDTVKADVISEQIHVTTCGRSYVVHIKRKQKRAEDGSLRNTGMQILQCWDRLADDCPLPTIKKKLSEPIQSVSAHTCRLQLVD